MPRPTLTRDRAAQQARAHLTASRAAVKAAQPAIDAADADALLRAAKALEAAGCYLRRQRSILTHSTPEV